MSLMYFQRVSAALKQARESWRNTSSSHEGDWQDDGNESMKGASMMHLAGGAMLPGPEIVDPERYLSETFAFDESSKCVPWLLREVEAKRAEIQHAYLFEAKINGAGRMQKEVEGRKVPYKISRVFGTEAFQQALTRGDNAQAAMKEAFLTKAGKLKEDWSGDGWGGAYNGPYDPNQYTEFAPITGGYFYAQQYLYDMLKGMAYSFEAWNHNPLAKRIIDGMAQYTLGRRFDWHLNPKSKDFNKKQKAWEKFATDINLRQRLSKYWIREKLIFGELFLNQKNWQSLHPATIWEIVTEPTDITNVYYYFRSFPTQYQMYSGYKVAGAAGSKDVPSMRYVVEQIPYTQLIHLKGNCTSFEKRGRPKLFPVLGWLKRVKDLYQAQITRAQMQSDYAWDVAVDGSSQDVASFQNSNSCIPRGTGNTFVHNKAVTRTPMPMATSGGSRGDTTVDNVLAFIATSCGFPKDFFNVISTGGGSRATALVGAEPFTKVIEDEQADWEFLLREKMFPEVMRMAGLQADEDDIEFVFPSVTKDTTSEAISNIQIGKAEGLISNETAGQMYAQEMSITTYDYNDQQQAIKNEQSRGDVLSVGGGLPSPGQAPGDADGSTGDGSIGDSPTHGQGKEDLEDSLNSI